MSNVLENVSPKFSLFQYIFKHSLGFIIPNDNFSGMSRPEALEDAVKGRDMKWILLGEEQVALAGTIRRAKA
jgi:hypothetical protein